jgi:uncharacterized protein (TIGR00730 family)
MIKTICVFCGSSMGANEIYSRMAENLAEYFLKNNIKLVYGGSNVGLMHILAESMLNGGGVVIGVMPKSLVDREVAHDHLTEMHIVGDMQERKALMASLSDAFIALPGAFGTLDELFEVLTWNQLGIITKPVGLLNINGYFDDLVRLLDKARDERFLRTEHHEILQVDTDPAGLFQKLENFRPRKAEKWIERLKEGKI